MKTILIFDQLFERPVSFRVVEGDYSFLNEAYVNSVETSEEDQDVLMGLLYKDEEGNLHDDWLSEFPVEQVAANTKVIVVGFLP
jgi:hypothetical protein